MAEPDKEPLPDFDEALRRIAHTPKGMVNEKQRRKENSAASFSGGATKPKTTNTN
jgi:hypothetical protein